MKTLQLSGLADTESRDCFERWAGVREAECRVHRGRWLVSNPSAYAPLPSRAQRCFFCSACRGCFGAAFEKGEHRFDYHTPVAAKATRKKVGDNKNIFPCLCTYSALTPSYSALTPSLSLVREDYRGLPPPLLTVTVTVVLGTDSLPAPSMAVTK